MRCGFIFLDINYPINITYYISYKKYSFSVPSAGQSVWTAVMIKILRSSCGSHKINNYNPLQMITRQRKKLVYQLRKYAVKCTRANKDDFRFFNFVCHTLCVRVSPHDRRTEIRQTTKLRKGTVTNNELQFGTWRYRWINIVIQTMYVQYNDIARTK